MLGNIFFNIIEIVELQISDKNQNVCLSNRKAKIINKY